MNEAVVNEDPEVNFREFKAYINDLGSHYKDLDIVLYDQYMVIDMKAPSASFARKSCSKALFMYDEGQPVDPADAILLQKK